MGDEPYTKLAQKIVYSSMWEEDGDTCKIWITLLGLKDRDGVVDKNITGIARIAKLPVEKVQEALAKFEAPDAKSTSLEHEGRRIKRLETGGWYVLNHEKYREYGWSQQKKEYERERKARYRESKAMEAANRPPKPPKEPKAPPPKKDAEIPEILWGHIGFIDLWGKWIEHLKLKRKSPTIHAMDLQLRKLSAMGPVRAMAALEHSIAGGYQGIYEPSPTGQFSRQPVQHRSIAEQDLMAAARRGSDDLPIPETI